MHSRLRGWNWRKFRQNFGIKAIEKAQQQQIDLAFLDIKMPEMGGIETLVKWKIIQSETQIVMISSYSDENLVREAIEKGAFTYLFKPLRKMDIISVTVKSLKNTDINHVPPIRHSD